MEERDLALIQAWIERDSELKKYMEEHENFERILDKKKEQLGVKLDTELGANDLKDIVRQYKKVYQEETGEEFPSDPYEQLVKSINAVFSSWNNERDPCAYYAVLPQHSQPLFGIEEREL